MLYSNGVVNFVFQQEEFDDDLSVESQSEYNDENVVIQAIWNYITIAASDVFLRETAMVEYLQISNKYNNKIVEDYIYSTN